MGNFEEDICVCHNLSETSATGYLLENNLLYWVNLSQPGLSLGLNNCLILASIGSDSS